MEKAFQFEKFTLISLTLLLFVYSLWSYLKIWFNLMRSGVKYDLGIPPFGTHWREIFKIESWHQTMERLYYSYPSERFVVLQDIGGKPAYLVRDPELVRKIAIRDFGSFVDRIIDIHPGTDPVPGHALTNSKIDTWKRLRNMVTPLMSGQKLKQIVVPSVDESKRDLVQFLIGESQKCDSKGLIVDIKDLSLQDCKIL